MSAYWPLFLLAPFVFAELFSQFLSWRSNQKPKYVSEEGIMKGAPKNEAAWDNLTKREQGYWLGRSSSEQDTYYQYILARAFPYEQYCIELDYVELPNEKRPIRQNLPYVTMRAMVSKARFDREHKDRTIGSRYPDAPINK